MNEAEYFGVFDDGRDSGIEHVLEHLQEVLDSMKSHNDNITSQVMNRMLDEIYQKVVDRTTSW